MLNPAKAISATFQANRLFAFQIARALIDAKALTAEQAAAVMVATAEQIRMATEDEEDEKIGAAFAIGFEEVGAWLLGGRYPVS